MPGERAPWHIERHRWSCTHQTASAGSKYVSCGWDQNFKKAALVRFVAPSIADGVNENEGIISKARHTNSQNELHRSFIYSIIYSMSRQFGPTPTSTSNGTSSEYAFSICSRANDFIASSSFSGTSNTSSSCTCKVIRDFRP